MLNPLTKFRQTASLFCALLLALSLLNACATKTASTGGVIKSIPKAVETTSESIDEQEDKDAEGAEQTDESLLTEDELDDDVSSAPIRTRTQEVLTQDELYDSSQSTYLLPPATKRRAQPEASGELKRAYRDALKEMEKALDSNKNFSTPISMFEELEKQYPEFSGPRTNIGMIYLHQKDFEKAAEAFKKALEINDENEHALSNLALTYRELGKFPEAKESYQKAIALNPNDPLPHYNLGILAELYLQDFPLAIQSYEHYKLANRKKDPEVDNWLIDLNNRVRQQQAAEQAKLAAEQQAANPVPVDTQQANGDSSETETTPSIDSESTSETPTAEAVPERSPPETAESVAAPIETETQKPETETQNPTPEVINETVQP